MERQDLKKIGFTGGLFFASILLVGSFHEYISCILSAALSAWLLLQMRNRKKLVIRESLLSAAVVSLVLFYGLTCLWAVDSGMAWIGFCKFLPLLLYLIALWQDERSGAVLSLLPYFGAVTVVLSVVGMLIPATNDWFSVAGRLAGFFQYPNTFALFLLVCELLLWKKTPLKLYDYLTFAILIGGLLYTGSRTVFVLFLLSNAAFFVAGGKKKLKFTLIALGTVVVLAAAVLIWGENTILHRYLTISLSESTFVGRLLYVRDALPLLLKYPFGMGYMGYYYIQGSIQTGVYSVVFAHNDFLQIFLDVGLIPGCLFLAAVGSFLLRKGTSAKDKILVGTVCLHCLLDFDLQFVSMFFLLILLLGPGYGKRVEWKWRKVACPAALTACILVSLYMGSALMLSHLGKNELSDKLYPYNTQNKIAMLEVEENIEDAARISDEILKQNTSYYVPYSIKAKQAYTTGSFASVIEYKHRVFELSPFTYEEYDEYCRMLMIGIELYEKAGDAKSADYCRQELLAVRELVEGLSARQSLLGTKITDQPVTELADDIVDYIETTM